MASVKEIRDRMRSINDTLKITNAMYLISSNKVRKARRMLQETEPFFLRVQDMLELILIGGVQRGKGLLHARFKFLHTLGR